MCNLLYLEDEIDILEPLSLLLEYKGFKVYGTTSVDEAQQILRTEPIDLALIDIMMSPPDDMDPELVHNGRDTGVELARRFKRMRPETPIVVLSVVKDPRVRAELLRIGVADIIEKPVDIDPLAEALLRVRRAAPAD